MATDRILILGSIRKKLRAERRKALAAYPELKLYKIRRLPILTSVAIASDAAKYGIDAKAWVLDLLDRPIKSFKPKYVFVHVGINFMDHPALLISTLLKLGEKYPHMRVGFQGGKEYALQVLKYVMIHDPHKRFVPNRPIVNRDLLSLLETADTFEETRKMRSLVRKLFPEKS